MSSLLHKIIKINLHGKVVNDTKMAHLKGPKNHSDEIIPKFATNVMPAIQNKGMHHGKGLGTGNKTAPGKSALVTHGHKGKIEGKK